MKKDTKQEKRKSYFIIGINPIEEMVKENPKRIVRVFCSFSSKVQNRKKALLQTLQKKQIPVEKRDSFFLEKKVGSSSHQGIIAEVLPKKALLLQEFLQRKQSSSLVVFLDEIFDPQNLGAILRVCECFQVDAVCFSRGASLSPSVSKASSGASEIVPLIEVKSGVEAIKAFQEKGFSIHALQIKKEAKEIQSYRFPLKSVLILGSEGKGIHPSLQKLADLSLYIPLKGKISSLNVSQAASIAIFLAKL